MALRNLDPDEDGPEIVQLKRADTADREPPDGDRHPLG